MKFIKHSLNILILNGRIHKICLILGLICLIFYFIGFQNKLLAQNCQNVGFENGDLSGYDLAEGRINADGSVTFSNIKTTQHKLMKAGMMDAVALLNCDINKFLPVVSPNGGLFSMRLGDSTKTGFKAGRAILKLTVTPEFTFFMLRYAVLLQDPGHRDYEQPRFSFRILDVNGNVFPCGEYLVRAAPSVPGFETCKSGWRVQPWQAIGFELKSYLGQTIQLEIIVTDCSLGAHAGYAYIDAACQPLEIKIDGYCEGGIAKMSLAGGFKHYLWSTGDTTSAISISHPVQGTTYFVTITGATGCESVLSQTIPFRSLVRQPLLDPMPDTTICLGNKILCTPKGKAVNTVYCKELGYSSDSFLLSPISNSQYTFIATDTSGCKTDTQHLNLNVADLKFNMNGDSLFCPGEAFKLKIDNPKSNVSYTWFPGMHVGTEMNTILDTNTTFIIEANNYIGCNFRDTIELKSKRPVVFHLNTGPDTSICKGNEIQIHPSGIELYRIYCKELGYSSDSFLLSPQSSSQFTFIASDSTTCKADTSNLLVKVIDTKFKIIGDQLICPGKKFNLHIDTPKPEFKYTWIPGEETGNSISRKMDSTTTYLVIAQSQEGCTFKDTMLVKSKRPNSFIVNVSIDTTICAGNKAVLNVTGNEIGSINWINLGQSETQVVVYPKKDENYFLQVIDNAGCDSINKEIHVNVVNLPQIELGDPICTQTIIDLNAKVLNEHPSSQYRWTWNNNSYNQRNTIESTGLYSVEVSNECGTVKDSVWVSYKYNEFKVYLPNVFSPNHDGTNDFFKPTFSTNPLNNYTYLFRIYDRWGTLIYNTNDINDPGWDGTFNSMRCAEGVYVWYVILKDNLFKQYECESPPREMGDVTLVR